MGCLKLSYYQEPRQIGKNHFFLGEPLEKRATEQFFCDNYSPFGLPIASNNYQDVGNQENRFLYQGKEWQTQLALNLYDFHARQYDPATGRFIGVDPKADLMAGWTPYHGMGNNPMLHTDPNGEILPIVAAAIWGAAIAGAGYTASVAMSDGGFDNWDWGQFGKSLGIGAVSGAVTFGIGDKVGAAGSFGKELGRASLHGVSNVGVNAAFGNDVSASTFAIGAGGSLLGSGMRAADFSKAGTTVGSSVFSGAIAEATGGDFWRGAATGATISLLNHYQDDFMEATTRPKKIDMAKGTDQEVVDQVSLAMKRTLDYGKSGWKIKHYFKNLDDWYNLTDGMTGGWQREVNGVFITSSGWAIPNATINIPLDNDFLRHHINVHPDGAARQIANGRYVYDFTGDIPGAYIPLKLMSISVPGWATNFRPF